MGLFDIFKGNQKLNINIVEDYKKFYLENKASNISHYGLIPFGKKGSSRMHKRPYLEVANIDFQFSKPCIWEDFDDEDTVINTLHNVEYGNITIASEGCETYWILITAGNYKGEVWLLTESGITPVEEKLTLSIWKTKQLESKNTFWHDALKNWGPYDNAFFLEHAPKKMVTLGEHIFGVITKMCNDCLNFISKAAIDNKKEYVVTDQVGTRVFYRDGRIELVKRK